MEIVATGGYADETDCVDITSDGGSTGSPRHPAQVTVDHSLVLGRPVWAAFEWGKP